MFYISRVLNIFRSTCSTRAPPLRSLTSLKKNRQAYILGSALKFKFLKFSRLKSEENLLVHGPFSTRVLQVGEWNHAVEVEEEPRLQVPLCDHFPVVNLASVDCVDWSEERHHHVNTKNDVKVEVSQHHR